MKCPVILKDHQIEHCKSIINRLDNELSYCDTSLTGLGKTHVALYVAWHLQNKLNTKVFIVGASHQSLHNSDGWIHWAKEYGIDITDTITYTKLRGCKGTVKHDWLVPIPETNQKYEASKKFKKLTNDGVFIIFDEFHKATRKSITHFACAALIRQCSKSNNCKVGLLSYTPGDKTEHYPQILRMCGLITKPILFHHVPFTSEYKWKNYGLGQLVKKCGTIIPENNGDLKELMNKINAKRSNIICKDLFDAYFKSNIMFGMPKPVDTVPVKLLNGFLKCTKVEKKKLNDAIGILMNSVRWNGTDVGARREWKMGGITIALKFIERAKLTMIARYVKAQKLKTPRKKFVISIGARCTQHHKMLHDMLSDKEYISPEILYTMNMLRLTNKNWKKISPDSYKLIMDEVSSGIQIINGGVSKEDRLKILKEFQSNNDNYWCLIISPGVGSESISLHDKHGRRPRELLIVPDHYHTRVTQTCGRINRVGVKSKVKVMMIYGKDSELETSVLSCMAKKSKIANDMLADNQSSKFPGDYDVWVQGKKDKKLLNKINKIQTEAIKL